MTDSLKLVGPVIGLFLLVVFILPQFVAWGINNYDIIENSGKSTVESGKKIIDRLCEKQYVISEIEDKIKLIPEKIVQSYNVNSEKDKFVLNLLQKYHQGIELTELELLIIANDIDKHAKMKYGFIDLEKTCNLKQYLEN